MSLPQDGQLPLYGYGTGQARQSRDEEGNQDDTPRKVQVQHKQDDVPGDRFLLRETSTRVGHHLGDSHRPHHTPDANIHILWR